MLRDRDTTGNGVLNERLYALQDPNFNVTCLIDPAGDIAERLTYTAYGQPVVRTPYFGERSFSDYDWEYPERVNRFETTAVRNQCRAGVVAYGVPADRPEG